jgi:hypothetical protein
MAHYAFLRREQYRHRGDCWKERGRGRGRLGGSIMVHSVGRLASARHTTPTAALTLVAAHLTVKTMLALVTHTTAGRDAFIAPKPLCKSWLLERRYLPGGMHQHRTQPILAQNENGKLYLMG